MNNENLKESKEWFTALAKQKARQNSHNKQMYWDDGKRQYFVEATKSDVPKGLRYLGGAIVHYFKA